ncbi:aminodeoxychorismate lyase [Vibrio sp. MACH09]|uniref:endolytic transglycosylase MltG n=1 Tax=unclassified Vibrio TaxID=2614977 RepID=UPI001493A696|nr:endolytic transglycosylase MltG [Vibrio sp. MACH09]NOI66371.1 endolytic transglycosylase MltG [Vibrio sp. 99-8-1]GLO60408.1 aminodeoxychorismate lyase [Vibrio sp. MACH09]
MIKKITLLLLLAVLLAGGGYLFVKKQTEEYANQSIQITEATIITIKSGSSFSSLLKQLEQQSWIVANQYSSLLRRFQPELTHIKAGTFLIQPEMTLADMLLFIAKGKEHQFAITFVEGSRFTEWRESLKQAEYLQQKIEQLTEQEIAERLAIPQKKLEGLFLAETYHYTAGMSDLDILKRAHRDLKEVLAASWDGRQEGLPLASEYEALILASIIEKETAIESERATVSSVFINRLKRGMRLQTDPTVIYGMGDKYNGNIRKKDLQTRTAYNTYVINGLPPTPIAMVGKSSIEAALQPISSNYLYFVASGLGGHVFSKNLKDHNRAVQQYLKQLRKKK